MRRIGSKAKALICAKACLDKKADGILILDMRRITDITDFFVICSGQSMRQVKAIADSVLDRSRVEQLRVGHVEGYGQAGWILLDYADVIVHIFYKEQREFYNLEGLWADVPRESIGEVEQKQIPDR